MYAILTPAPRRTNNVKRWSAQRWVDQRKHPHMATDNATLQIAKRACPPCRAPRKTNWRCTNLVSINHIVDSAPLTDVLWFALLQCNCPQDCSTNNNNTFPVSSCKISKHSTFLTPTLKHKDFGCGDDLRRQRWKGPGYWYDSLSLGTIWYLVNHWDLIPFEKIKSFWIN